MMKRFVLAAVICSIGCSRAETSRPLPGGIGGNSLHGQQLITQYGCPTCHIIPGISAPSSTIGPSLEHLASRPLIARKLPNNPETIVRWLQSPQGANPESAMPNLGVTAADARDITAYLSTLR